MDPVAISLGAPGELAQPPAIRERSPGRQGDRHQVAVFSTVTSRCRDDASISAGTRNRQPFGSAITTTGLVSPAAGTGATSSAATGATHAAEADASRTNRRLRTGEIGQTRSGVLGSAPRMACQADERTGNLSELPRSKAEIQGWFAGIALARSRIDAPPDGRGDPFRIIRGHPTQQRANSRASVRDNIQPATSTISSCSNS